MQMLLNLLFENPAQFVLIFGGLVIAIGLHEAAHCFMADKLGDPTPRSLGRTTLNPLAHLDPLGTLAILVSGFGWGKPAPYDPFNLKDPKIDSAKIALAGPATNIIIAILISLILRLITPPIQVFEPLVIVLILNIQLAIFNLIPVPPLDGSKVLGAFLSHEQAARVQLRNDPFLLLLLIMPIFGGTSIASLITSPITNFLLSLLIPLPKVSGFV